jgi:hypothetical protein
MNEKISQYIQQRLEEAKAERLRLEQEAIANANAVLAERKLRSLNNTLRAFNLLGIEVGESDLVYTPGDDDGLFCGYYLLFGDFRIGLTIDNHYVNVLEESEEPYTESEKAMGYRDRYTVEFQLVVYRIIPDALWTEYRQYQESGGYRHFFFNQEILKRFLLISSESETPQTCLPKVEIDKFFALLATLESDYQDGVKNWENWRGDKGLGFMAAKIANRAAPKFTYSGDSREAILSQLLRDIANPPKLECPECGRKSVDSVDFYCTRCGVDYEV